MLSTLLHACDADYQLVVIADCCADLDAELHEALLKRLFPQRAAVVTAAEFVQALQSTWTGRPSVTPPPPKRSFPQ